MKIFAASVIRVKNSVLNCFKVPLQYFKTFVGAIFSLNVELGTPNEQKEGV